MDRDITITAGDTVAWQFSIKDPDMPVDLQNVTAELIVSGLNIHLTDGIVDPEQGTVAFFPSAEDTANKVANNEPGIILVTFPRGYESTFHFDITIKPRWGVWPTTPTTSTSTTTTTSTSTTSTSSSTTSTSTTTTSTSTTSTSTTSTSTTSTSTTTTSTSTTSTSSSTSTTVT